MPTNFSTVTHQQLTELSQPIQELLSATPYNPPESHDVSIKSLLQSLLPSKTPNSINILPQIRDFCLLNASISSFYQSTSPLLNWIPDRLIVASHLAMKALSEAVYGDSHPYLRSDTRLVIDLMPEVIPLIKETIKESSIAGDEISAASSRVPTAYAIVAAYQLSWLVSQVEYRELRKLCGLIIPCGLTALDHWSSEVKGQGMISFIHVAKNVDPADLGGYGDVILDACCHNIVSDDEIWHLAVEMSVRFVTHLQKNNPRSPWFERLLNEMLGHLERQPRDKKRRIAWLELVEPLFCCVGLVLLAHFRRLFPLFFQWVHADDDETVLLALRNIYTVVRLTWLRSSPHTIRLVDELVILYKDAALKTARDDIRSHICQIMILLQQSKGLQFEATWEKYKDDPNLGTLVQSIANGFPVVKGTVWLT